VPDIGFDPAERLFEGGVLGPAGDDLEAPEDGIAGPEEGHELLVEHYEIARFDLPFEEDDVGTAPVALDREDAQAFGLEVPPDVGGGAGGERPGEDPAILGGQAAEKRRHLGVSSGFAPKFRENRILA
jgi:hypothetical protein